MSSNFPANKPHHGLAVIALLALAGCATPRYTVDDGRPVDEVLLKNIRLLGQGERLLRPAIVRSAQLNDPDCATQWELPFSVASSYEWKEDERVAWMRGLQVDERLSIISTSAGIDLDIGERLVELDGYARDNSTKMLAKLADLRDSGDTFQVKTSTGKKLAIKPLKVCRGYTRLATPDLPYQQDFHWLINTHPLSVCDPLVTPDEALWMVLWGQGLSEEGGGRMKTFHYSKQFIITLVDVASLAVGLNAAGQAAKVAVNQAAQAAAQKAATEAVARQILEQAGRDAAQAVAKEYAQKFGEEIAKSAGKEIVMSAGSSFAKRVGLMGVSGVSLVASTAFDQADAWAFERLVKLRADPLAGATLHRKLIDHGLLNNAFTLDDERIGHLALKAKARQLEAPMISALRGAPIEGMSIQLTDLPSAYAPGAESLPTQTSETLAAERLTQSSPTDLSLNMPSANDND